MPHLSLNSLRNNLLTVEKSLGKKLVHFVQKGRIRLDKKFVVFLFFLLLSTIFWFLNQLGKNSSTLISYPVKYTNLPKDKVLVRDLPSRLDLLVEAPGYTLLKYKLSNRLIPLVMDLNAYPFRIMENSEAQKFFILTSMTRERISRQLRSDIQILDISPDSLIFEFGNIVNRIVPVEPDMSIELSKQFMLKGEITVDPDSIMVSGPDRIVDTLKRVYTKHQELNEVNLTLTKSFAIESIRNVSFSHKKVMVTIPVEQFTEAIFKVPIETVAVPDTLVLKTFPGTVTLSCMVGLSDYERLSPHSFKAVVDYTGIENNLSNKLKVSIDRFPEYVKSIRFHPINVDFIIER